ncbi:MAG TPA: DnaA regulatory inactivator Hda [Candidatus Kapabacteria bacterium]|nr:DnaA regulatory inactivator Hda [Candidatus Kapabacteria bacterium]
MSDRSHPDNLHPQLTLPLSGVPDFDFESFNASGNEQLLHRLHQIANGREPGWLFLSGAAGAGKSHLLQAVCLAAQQAGLHCLFVSGRELQSLHADVLQELSDVELLCIDDLDRLLGQPAWEEQLFHLYNRLREQGGCLLLAASAPPRQLNIGLEDLRSRFAAMELYAIQPLGDDDKRRVLQRAAQSRGFALADDVAAYILQRSSRDMVSLQKVLNRLDQQSLREQRLITLPFVKKVMHW